MSKRATIAEVATLAGVHKATVSRALNAATEHHVKVATVKRIQRAAKQLGYVPNIMARGLRTHSSMTIGVIVPDLTNPIFPPILRGIENYLSPRGYTALVSNADGRDSLERAAFESLFRRHVDGFILATGQTDHPLLASAHDRQAHVVLVNRGTNVVPFPLVTGDDSSGIAAVIDHLYKLGHRNIIHISGPSNFTTSLARSAAFTATSSSKPDLKHSLVSAEALTVTAGQAVMDEMLSATPSATAVVASNDLLALGVLRSLRAHGIDCPRDVSVTGFNDIPFAEDFYPALTTVRVPYLEMGVESARLLLERLESTELPPVTVTLPVSLIVRKSTAPPAPN